MWRTTVVRGEEAHDHDHEDPLEVEEALVSLRLRRLA
jgi:hypothetical protein